MRRPPSLPDLVFGVVLVLGLIGGHYAFLNDPGTFWHVELGLQILATGEVPRADTFTYTRQGAPWVDAAWGSEFIMALVVDHLGWGGLVSCSALVLAWTYRMIASWLIEEGRSPWAAGVATLVAVGVGASHFLARPHLATITGVAYTLHACRKYHRGTGALPFATLPLMFGLWSTLHGGFLAGPFIVACSALGVSLSGPWDRSRRLRVALYAAVGLVGVAVPLLGPYGMGLYRHVAHLMVTSGVTALIIEHQPTRLADPDARVLELLVIALIALPGLTGMRLPRFEMVHVIAWFYLGMSSVRHAPLFGIAAAPTLAILIDSATTSSIVPAWLTSRRWAWSGLATLVIGALDLGGAPFGEHDPARWPTACREALDWQPTSARLFHDLEWGGLIAEGSHPRRLTFIDDRFELFGKQAIVDYCAALTGGPAWDGLDARERFDLAWVRADGPLSRRLADDPRWSEVARDPVSVLYRREKAPGEAMPLTGPLREPRSSREGPR
jgi:hypothetical protein